MPGDYDCTVSATDLHVVTFDDALDADAGDVAELGNLRKFADFELRRARDGLSDRMFAGVLDSPGQPQDLGSSRAVQRNHVDELHLPLGDRACLCRGRSC